MEQIKEQFDKVIAHNVPIDNPEIHSDPLFYKWYINKQKFIKALNGYIYEYSEPVSIDLTEESRKCLINNFLDQCFYRHFKSDSHFNYFWDFVQLNKNSFFNNITETDFKSESLNINIPKGSKLIKSFKYFIKEEELRHLQDEASLVIQQQKLEGTLCFSAHPLDYLSISESAHNWKSCHSLTGCYCAGNLSYMCDNSTIICYIRANEKGYSYNLPSFPSDITWNSKKWRSLIHINPTSNGYLINKSYPFQAGDKKLNDTIENILISLGLIKSKSPGWGLPTFKPIDSCNIKRPDGEFNKRIIDIPSYVIRVDNKKDVVSIHDFITLPEKDKRLFYCDLTESYNFSPSLNLEYKQYYEKIDLNVNVPCPVCGLEDLTHHSLMIGNNCMKLTKDDATWSCYDCDEDIPIKDLISIDGCLYCQDCYDDMVWECAVCGEKHVNYPYKIVNNKKYCQDCLENRKDDIINGN